MKRLLSFAFVLALLPVSLFASSKSETVTLWETVTVGSRQLTPGQYKVSWSGSGPKVQVTLAKDRKSSVTLDAKLVEAEHADPGVVVSDQGTGVKVLQQIRLKHESLIFDDAQTEKN